jgi:3-isopropylmalate/(R)-2-methylmalate dehydratase small subunit
MILSGRVWKLGDDVGATDIVSAEYDKLGMSHQWGECAQYVLKDVRPELAGEVKPGDIVVAGRNFGTGHAHYYSTAIMACKAAGIAGLFGESVSGLFQRAAIDFGMPM